MNNKYIFDVDGTLTPSRQQMDTEFKKWFRNFCFDNEVYIVTGSDKPKTIEQIGPVIWSLARRVYQCSGNDVWEGEENIRVNDIELTSDMQKFFDVWLSSSPYQTRTGTHVDVRCGLINFSVIGRGATKSQREDYVKYDAETSERKRIAEEFNTKFGPHMIAQVAGETGIDIIKSGHDKSQIISDFSYTDRLHFFGDKMQFGGNDYTLAIKVANSGGNVYFVNDWRDTWEHLKKL